MEDKDLKLVSGDREKGKMHQIIMVNLKQNCIEFFDTNPNSMGEKSPTQS